LRLNSVFGNSEQSSKAGAIEFRDGRANHHDTTKKRRIERVGVLLGTPLSSSHRDILKPISFERIKKMRRLRMATSGGQLFDHQNKSLRLISQALAFRVVQFLLIYDVVFISGERLLQ
jgi:hypothetical protein